MLTSFSSLEYLEERWPGHVPAEVLKDIHVEVPSSDWSSLRDSLLQSLAEREARAKPTTCYMLMSLPPLHSYPHTPVPHIAMLCSLCMSPRSHEGGIPAPRNPCTRELLLDLMLSILVCNSQNNSSYLPARLVFLCLSGIPQELEELKPLATPRHMSRL